VLSVAISLTGLVTYAYFALASHALSAPAYGALTVLWSVVFVSVSVLYRPIEALLSRSIAEKKAQSLSGTQHLRAAAFLQIGLACGFCAIALVFRRTIETSFFANASYLYWILLVSVAAYAGSYFARGLCAGQQRFRLYGVLVFCESAARCVFALGALVGIGGELGAATGIAAAPAISVLCVSLALKRATGLATTPTARDYDTQAGSWLSLRQGGGFTAAVILIMLCEQIFLNAGPLVIKVSGGPAAAAVAGYAFNALLIARAPLQLFQSVSAPILPHLTRLQRMGAGREFAQTVRSTLLAVAGFCAVTVVVCLAVGPLVMGLLFGSGFGYGRVGLAVVGAGMGLYLASATLGQAALARHRAAQAGAVWLLCAVILLALVIVPQFSDRVLQIESAYAISALALFGGLLFVFIKDKTAASHADRDPVGVD
jgi:O-antigen/teichoic acid export membrane protein